jgi:hypothetical protein
MQARQRPNIISLEGTCGPFSYLPVDTAWAEYHPFIIEQFPLYLNYFLLFNKLYMKVNDNINILISKDTHEKNRGLQFQMDNCDCHFTNLDYQSFP